MTPLLLACALLAPPEPSAVVLRYAFVKGQERVYELTETFFNPRHGEVTRTVDEVRLRVDERNASGAAKLTVRRRPLTMQMDGGDVPVAPDAKPYVTSEWRSPRGDVRKREPVALEPTAHARVLRLRDVLYPGPAVAVGDTWRAAWPAEDELRLPAAAWSYRLTTLTATLARFEYDFAESQGDAPIVAKGFAEVDRSSGWPRRIELKAANVELPGDEERVPMSYAATYVAKEPK